MVRLRQPKPRHRAVILWLLAAALVPLVACRRAAPTAKLFDPSQVAFSATYNPLFDSQLYPSMILATTSTSQPPAETFTATLTSPADNAVLRIVIDSSSLNYVTIFQEILPRRGQTYTFQPSIKWKYDQLRSLRQPRTIDLTFTCYINDEEVDIKNLHLNCRSVNECPLSLLYQGRTTDFRYLFAAYVNEDHPQIEQILADILAQGTVSRFSGYQNGPESVRRQVFSIWYYILNRGIAYSSITCTSNPSPRANVQHIRFFDEVWETRQANCVDACVFFASILRKIGLKPVIFVEPCHAYLGYYTDKNRRHLELLETTITAWVNFPDIERNLRDDGLLDDAQFLKISKYLDDKDIERYHNHQLDIDALKLAVARNLFSKATDYDRETYQANLAHFADTASITYQRLDIEQLRQSVQPIN
ncbi:MAG: hypothetical protein IJU19_03395 [Bacteroidales bacterium]|nr:hypothetical protein [Bacteroidales bacterium]